MKYKKILVTGGAGFIGSNFVRYATNKYPDTQIINLDALTYAGNKSSVEGLESLPNYVFVEGNINDQALIDNIMAQVEAVIHFAAETHVDRSILSPDVFLETNVLGTHNLLKAALKNKIKRFHHISTDEVFGSLELESSDKFTEVSNYDPRSPYSASKAASDHLVRAYGETYGLPYTITNCSNNYGEYHHPEKLFPLTITHLIQNKKVPIYGDGLNVRDWLYVQDHCRAIDLVLNEAESHQTYLVGGLKNDVSNLEVVKMIMKIMGKSEDLIEFVKDRSGHDRRYAVDWNKLNQDLGWEPTVSLEEGLTKTINWYLENRDWWQPLLSESKLFFKENYEDRKR